MSEQSVAAIQKICDPFRDLCWPELNRPITRREVTAEIARYRKGLDAGKSERKIHLRKIAQFAVDGWKDPIHIDVGCAPYLEPLLWHITDGNHRFAAAIYRRDPTIHAEISGSIQLAQSIGLNP